MTRLDRLLAHLHSHRFLVASLLDRSERLMVSRAGLHEALRECVRLREENARLRAELVEAGQLDHIGWTWPDANYPRLAPFHFLPNDGGDPPAKPGLRKAYAFRDELRGLDSADLEWLHEIEER